MGRTCKAPDCDEEITGGLMALRGYCSTLCENVAMEAAAKAMSRAAETGNAVRMEDLPDDELAEIRDRNQRSFKRIEMKMKVTELEQQAEDLRDGQND